MKKVILLLVIFPAIISCGCKKKDFTNTTDITQFSWNIKSITINGDKKKVKKGNSSKNKAYILYFKNDSNFKLNTSRNSAGGTFQIVKTGNINIFQYGGTKIGGENEIDENLRQCLPSISSYKVLGKNLILFKGKDCEIELKKKK